LYQINRGFGEQSGSRSSEPKYLFSVTGLLR
ncbi:MAG: hypothetical protein ACI92A_002615, partial [Candidatus Paceibacteria bacterium]